LNCPEEWLDSVSISRCDEQLSPCIVKAKGKFATELRQEVHTIVKVQGDDIFTIAFAFEAVQAAQPSPDIL
jgi:hypothetical protein